MTTKQTILIILLGVVVSVVIGNVIGNYINSQNEDLVPTETDQPEQILRPTVIESLTDPVLNGIIEKRFTHGDTEIDYTVRVENGVESTPAPDILLAMQASYSEAERAEQKRIIAQAVLEGPHGTGPNGTGRVIGFTDSEGNPIYVDVNRAYKNTLIHVKNNLKKEYIDTNFTCDNFNQLAQKFVGESMYGVGYAGSVENYIYTRAFNECIDPKYQEAVEKVYHELEEVNATSVEDVNVYD